MEKVAKIAAMVLLAAWGVPTLMGMAMPSLLAKALIVGFVVSIWVSATLAGRSAKAPSGVRR